MPASLRPQSLPPGSPTMASVLVIQHGRDVHARRVVPDEERLARRLRIVAIDEVDDLGRDFLVDTPSIARVSAGPDRCTAESWLYHRTCTTGRCAEASGKPSFSDRPRPVPPGCRGSAYSCTAGQPSAGWGLVDVREAHALHRIEVIQVAPEFLEAVRGRQRVGVIAEMVLAELAGVVAEIEQEFGERRGAGPQIGRAAGQLRRIMPVRSGCMPVKKALRPAVQLCSA